MRVCASRLAWDCSSSDWRHQPGDSRGPAWGYRDIALDTTCRFVDKFVRFIDIFVDTIDRYRRYYRYVDVTCSRGRVGVAHTRGATPRLG